MLQHFGDKPLQLDNFQSIFAIVYMDETCDCVHGIVNLQVEQDIKMYPLVLVSDSLNDYENPIVSYQGIMNYSAKI